MNQPNVDEILQSVLDNCPAAERVRMGETLNGTSDLRAIITAVLDATQNPSPATTEELAAETDGQSCVVRQELIDATRQMAEHYKFLSGVAHKDKAGCNLCDQIIQRVNAALAAVANEGSK